jgi:hypothetical protein
VWWLTIVIPDKREVEVRGSWFKDNPGKKFARPQVSQ